MGENDFASLPVLAYGVVSLGAANAYYVLQRLIIRSQGDGSALAEMIGRDLKGKASPLLYVAAIASAHPARWISLSLYVVVALMWLVPDRRIERAHRVA